MASYDDPLHEADFQAARALFVSPQPSQRKLTYLVVSLVLFAVVWVARGGNSYLDLVYVVGVLLVHELGHAIAMLVFGYRDVKIFFIPMLGAAAAGRPLGVARWRQAVVLLAGPLPGLVVGCALRYFAEPSSVTMHVAAFAIAINAINLLPVEPLDGGRLFQVLVFSRNRHLEVMFRVVTAALVVGVSLYLHLWALAFFAYVALVTLPQTVRLLAAAEPLKTAGLPEDPAKLDESQLRVLHTTVWNTFTPQVKTRIRSKPAPQASWMEAFHQRAILRAPSWLATSAVLAMWAGGTALAAITLLPGVQRLATAGAAHHVDTWRAYRGSWFTVDIPDGARVIADKPTYLAFTDDQSVVGVRYQTLQNPDTDYVAAIEAQLHKTAQPASRPHDFIVMVKGQPMRLRVQPPVVSPNGDRIGYTLEAWPDDDAGMHFLESFHADTGIVVPAAQIDTTLQ